MYPPIKNKCLHTWEYGQDTKGKYFACEQCGAIELYEQSSLEPESRYRKRVRAEIYAEIIQIFDSRGMQGAKHWREEIQSMINVIVQAHEETS